MNVYQRCQRHRRYKRKILRYNFFSSYFVQSLVGCTLHLKNFCLFLIFRCRQANIGRNVLSPVSTTPPINLSVVSLTPLNSFSAVSLTPVINFRFFGYFWPVSTTPGKNVINCSPVSTIPLINCSPVSTTPPINFSLMINCIDDRGLFFLQIGTNRWYLLPPKSDMAANGVIGTAMKSCFHRHPAHLDKRPLKPPKLLETKTTIFSFGGLRGLWLGCVGCIWMKLLMAVPMTSSAARDITSGEKFSSGVVDTGEQFIRKSCLY